MDKKAEAELELLVATAVMYFERHMSQEAIGRHLGVSRSTVSRLLVQARERGLVRIEIVPPTADGSLAEQVVARLGLRAAHIAPGRAQEAEPGPVLAEPLAAALDDAQLAPGEVVLVSPGRDLASASRHMRRSETGALVAPALGGSASDDPWTQPNEIARLFARALSGHPRFLHAPAVVTEELAAALHAESQTEAVMELWGRAKVAVTSVAGWPLPSAGPATPAIENWAREDDEWLSDHRPDSAVGHVIGIPFAAHGALVPRHRSHQLLGVSPEQLRRIPHVIAVASGASKVGATIAAVRAGLVNTLVTDAFTARAILAALDA